MKPAFLTPLLNREFKLPDDGVFQFAPLGEFPIVDPVTKNRVIQVVDAESVRAMAANIAALKAQPHWPGLLVDRDHFSFDTEKESRAAGWANDAQERADGLFGPIRFTNSGKTDVEGGEYRFLSPVFDRKSAVPLGGNRFRVTKLLGLALTNTPNIRNIQALTNRAESFNGREATHETQDKGQPMPKERLIAILSLAATATEDQLVEAVQALKNRASQHDALKGQFDALTTDHTALKNRHTALLNRAVENALEEFKVIILPDAKDAWKNRLTADFDGTVVLLKGLKPAGAAAPDQKRIDDTLAEFAGVITAESKDAWKNRLTSDFDGTVALLKGIKKPAKKPPLHQERGSAAAADGEGEQHAFMNRVGEVMKERKLDKADAIAAVAGEEPELYGHYRDSITSAE